MLGRFFPIAAFAATLILWGAGEVAIGAEADQPQPIDFRNQIEPILSRHGCNSGGCHGKASGQNGFKLSLFGFDDKYDYEEIVRRARGRRVNLAAPEHSLLLMKATGQLPHGGGQRIEPGSEAHQMLVRWIAAGTPASAPDAPHIVKLHVEPRQITLQPGQTQQLAVVAEYSSGERRTVTTQAEYHSNLDVVAAVDDEGLIRAGDERGEAAIMARYVGQVAVAYTIVPHGQPLAEIPGWVEHNFIDKLAAEKWKKLGLLPSPVCDD